LKTYLILIIITAMLLIPAGCGRGGARVAFLLYDGSDTFISEMTDRMLANIPDGIQADVFDAGNSQAVQNQQIVETIAGKYDLLVVNPVDRLACGVIAEKCVKENVPIIFFNREPLKDAMFSDKVFYVGAAADSLGEKQAVIAADIFTREAARYDRNGDGVIQLVILKGEQGHQDAEKRADNCVNKLKELGFRVETLAVEIADWNRRKAYEAMSSLYARFGGAIELVFAGNDDMALGAIDYLTADGGGKPFLIIGVDGTAVGLEAVGKGLLYGTVNNDLKKQSDAILTLADYILGGRDLADFPYPITGGHYIFIDGDIITMENLADYS